MKIQLTNLSYSLTIIIIIDAIFTTVCNNKNNVFHMVDAIQIERGRSLGVSTTRKPDYSDVYEKIDENDMFKNIRRIMRFGDPANGIYR